VLPPCVLNHIEVESAVLDTVAELEHFELAFGGAVLLISQIGENILHVLGCVFDLHFLWDFSS